MKKIFYLSAVILLVMSPVRVSAQNNALHFDGVNDYVNIPITLSGEGTFSFWIKLDQIPTDNARILSEVWDTDEIIINANVGTISTVGSFVSGDDLTSTSPLPVNVWTHVAITANGSGSSLYINGNLDDTGGAAAFSLTDRLRIGGQYTALWEVVPGQIDEFRIWSDVRTEEEIRANMYTELVGNEANFLAYYKFNETSGITADNAEGTASLDGTLNNMAGTEWIPSSAFFGPKNTLSFNGDAEYVNCGNDASLQISGTTITLEAWINASSFATESYEGSIIDFHNASQQGYGLRCGGTGVIGFNLGDGVSWHSISSPDNTLSLGTWHHVAGVYDGTTQSLYVDGVLVASTSTSFTIAANTSSSFYIAESDVFSPRSFIGSIDDICIWNTARTTSQIRENMMTTLTGNESGLVAYYNFDNTSGLALQDFSGNGNDGTLVNMAYNDWVTSTAFNTWLSTSSSTLLDPSNWSNGLSSGAANFGFHNWLSSSQLNISSALTLNNLYVGTGIGASGGIVSSGGFTIYSNLFINSPLSISSATEHLIYGDMIIGSGGELNSYTGAMVTILGDLENAGQVHLYSPSNMNTGSSLIVDGTTTNTGTMTLDRYISAGTLASDNYNWHMMSLPVASAQANSFYLNDYVYAYNENNTWDNLPLETDMVNRGQGYIVKTLSNKTVSYSGTFNSGDINVSVTSSSAGSSSQGFNLVGNPYPSAIDLEAIGRTGIGNTFWVWDGSAYLAYNVVTHAGDRRYVQPGQGFFTWSDLASGTVGFTNASQVHYTDGTFLKKSDNSMDQMILKVSNGEYSDKLYISHADVANDGFKLFSMNPVVPQLFVKDDFDVNFAIYNLQGELAGQEISLGFRSDLEETFSFEVSELMFDTYDIILRDELTNSETLLEEGLAVNFSHSPDATDHRFTLIISTKSTIGIEDESSNWNWVYSENMNINVMTPGILNADISVMNLNGQLITQFRANSDRNRIPIPTEGLYLVKIVSNNQVSLKKIIVK